MRNPILQLILIFLAVPALSGCSREAPRREEDSSGSQVVEEKWEEFLAFSPTAPPPLARGPSGGGERIPTRHAPARVGMRAVYRITPERGDASRHTIEVIRTDAGTAQVHQIAETETYGRYIQELSFPRFFDASSEGGVFNPVQRERRVGDRIVTVGSKKLLCSVHETQKGPYVYRSLYCDEAPGGLVRHSDNASGVWKTRLQLVEIED
ncbi:MAG: hypothetical protein JXA11_16575 [Phycisphaerae bacterium]|nr:hypothetical protein [Phycisphaerae bacterium]